MRKFLLGVAAATAIFLANKKADAAVTVNIFESGGNVVAEASGTLNLSGLTPLGGGTSTAAELWATFGTISFFNAGSPVIGYTFSGPNNWGSGPLTTILPTSGASPIAINSGGFPGGPVILVASDFVSGGSVTGSVVLASTTLAALGLTSDTYIYTSSADTVTVNIGVPEPTSMALLGAALVGLCASIRRRRAA